jgi:hypothetical protein
MKMINCPSTDEVVLELQIAHLDSYMDQRFVRLPFRILFELGILINDVVQIEGGPNSTRMDLITWQAYPEDEGRNVCRINEQVMKEIHLKEGDLVKVRVSPFQAAALQRKEHLLHHNFAVRLFPESEVIDEDLESIFESPTTNDPLTPTNALSEEIMNTETMVNNRANDIENRTKIDPNLVEDDDLILNLEIAAELDHLVENFKKD